MVRIFLPQERWNLPFPLAASRPARQRRAMPTDHSPTDEEIVARVHAQLGFALPLECVPGVRANLALLDEHLRTIEGAGE